MGKLTHEDRCKIETLDKAGVNAYKIALTLEHHKSTITRELARNSVNGIYNYKEATQLSKKR